MRPVIRSRRPGQVGLDLLPREAVLSAELYPRTRRALALRALRRDPDDLARNRNPFRLIQQAKEQEDLVAEAKMLVRRNEQTAMAQKRHVRGAEHAPIPDPKGQNAIVPSGFLRDVGRARHEAVIMTDRNVPRL